MKKHIIRIVIAAVSVVAAIGIYALSINFYVIGSQKKNIKTADNINSTYDCIIILGCGVKPDGTPSAMLNDRLETGIELYKKGVAPVIIMSGDHGRENYDEVTAMKQYAADNGVPTEKIFLDHAGFSTYESMVRAEKIFGVKSAVLVTQKYHLYRSLMCAEDCGINAVGVGADIRQYFGQIKRDIREIIARNKDFLFCVFEPDPTYLGEKIPLSGNGNDTN